MNPEDFDPDMRDKILGQGQRGSIIIKGFNQKTKKPVAIKII